MSDHQNNMRMGMKVRANTAENAAESPNLDDGGYILAVLLVGMAIAAVWLTASLPAWRQQEQREREADLIFRGEQYARAIALYYAKNNRTFPTDFDTLVTQHYLRKKWKDPVTGDDFAPLYAGQATTPGVGSSNPNSGRSGPGATAPQGQPVRNGQPGTSTGQFGGTGGIQGVVSKSTAASIKVYNGQQEYDQWLFSYQTACRNIPACSGAQAPAGGGPAGGGPNGRGPNGGPAGGPGNGRNGPTGPAGNPTGPRNGGGGPTGPRGPGGGGPGGGGPGGTGRTGNTPAPTGPGRGGL